MSLADLHKNINLVNGFHPSINFTFEISFLSVNFLDICLCIGDKKTALLCSLQTYLYDLTFTSSNLFCCKGPIPFSQILDWSFFFPESNAEI